MRLLIESDGEEIYPVVKGIENILGDSWEHPTVTFVVGAIQGTLWRIKDGATPLSDGDIVSISPPKP